MRYLHLWFQEVNSRNMVKDNAFAIPWDLHPRSLHAEFAHNTDLLATLDNATVTASRDVGVYTDSTYGLGGGNCRDVLRDGTAAEMVGRLCVEEGRAESIEAAIRAAERPRPLGRGVFSRSRQVFKEAQGWKLDGPARTRKRKMVKLTEDGREKRNGRRGSRRRGGSANGKAKGRGRQ